MKTIAVYCGSSSGNNKIYKQKAAAIGSFLAQEGIDLVFGGGKVGLMGVLADAALEAGGKVTGVIPAFLQTKEVAHEKLTELIVVENMHARKALIHEMSDVFVDSIAEPKGEFNETIKESLLESIELIKEEVKVQQWKLVEPESSV